MEIKHTADDELFTTRKHNHMLFVSEDFRNWEGFIAKLRAHTDPVSERLWNRMSADARDVIIDKSAERSKCQDVVLKELNTILRSDVLYNEQVFQKDSLSKKTLHLLKSNPHGSDLLELNRRLIEDCYPLELLNYSSSSPLQQPAMLLEFLLKLFPIAAVIIYATGFLIVNAFLDRFGIAEASNDFLKINYIQVGLLYLMFPLFVLVPIFIFYRLRNMPHATTRMPSIAIIGMTNLLFTFYWFATYAQPGEFYNKRTHIACLFLWTVWLSISARRFALGETSDLVWIDNLAAAFVDPLFSKCQLKTRTNIVRAIFGIVLAGLSWLTLGRIGITIWLILGSLFLLSGIWRSKRLSELQPLTRTRIIGLIGLAVGVLATVLIICMAFDRQRLGHLAFYYLYWCILSGYFWKELKSIYIRFSNRERVWIWSLRSCIFLALYYLGILGFAYGIYPNIPIAKGGGNYTGASNVVLYYRPDANQMLPTSIVIRVTNTLVTGITNTTNIVLCSPPLKLIYSTPSTLYLADPKEPRASEGVTNWSQWLTPEPIAVKHECVAAMLHQHQ